MLIVGLDVKDVRFPTSDHKDGSDAMHAAPDYSAAYVTLTCDNGMTGNGITFTLGRGPYFLSLLVMLQRNRALRECHQLSSAICSRSRVRGTPSI